MSLRTETEHIRPGCNAFLFSAGSWTPNISTDGLIFNAKTAAAETVKVVIPLRMARRSTEGGVALKRVELPYRVSTADLTATPTIQVFRTNYKAGVAPIENNDVAAITGTTTGASVTAGAVDRLLAFDVTLPTLDLPVQNRCGYVAVVTFAAAATSALRVYDALAEYDYLT